jgi:translation initiation factor IF-3
LSRPFPSRPPLPSGPRVNGKIRAREVRLLGLDGKQMLGIYSLPDALTMARQQGVDLVEIAANATPPVCRLVDFGKFRYEQSKRDKESKKHQHATKVKEIQLSPKIDPHDLGVKLGHAIDFLCEDMKVKVTLRFRGREMAHTEFGFQVVSKFLDDITPYGHRDAEPKLIGRGINVMISPLPRNKRAKNPRLGEGDTLAPPGTNAVAPPPPRPTPSPGSTVPKRAPTPPQANPSPPQRDSSGFTNNPFAELQLGSTALSSAVMTDSDSTRC